MLALDHQSPCAAAGGAHVYPPSRVVNLPFTRRNQSLYFSQPSRLLFATRLFTPSADTPLGHKDAQGPSPRILC